MVRRQEREAEKAHFYNKATRDKESTPMIMTLSVNEGREIKFPPHELLRDTFTP